MNGSGPFSLERSPGHSYFNTQNDLEVDRIWDDFNPTASKIQNRYIKDRILLKIMYMYFY